MEEAIGNNGYHKGLFNLGKWNESAARVGSQFPKPLNSIVIPKNGSKFLSVKSGIQYINAQDVIDRSAYCDCINYNTRFFSKAAPEHVFYGLVGWLDPVGSHDDYFPHNDSDDVQVFDVIHSLLRGQIINSDAQLAR